MTTPTHTGPQDGDACWVCLEPFGRAALADEVEGSPLGGAFSSPKCEMCRTHRATTQGQGSRMIMNRGMEQCLARETTGGSHRPGPVHIFVDGTYVPLREWAASRALPEYERRWRSWEADTSSECPAQ